MQQDKYAFLDEIDRDGFITIYRAEHRFLHIPRIVKVLRRDQDGVDDKYYCSVRARFKLEAQLGVKFNGVREIVQVVDYEENPDSEHGWLALILEQTPGTNLSDKLIAEGRLSVKIALEIAKQIASGLSALHREGVVHCSLKPSNIVFNADGRAMVTNLGSAQVGQTLSDNKRTEPIPTTGISLYTSPEQAGEYSHLTPASDVYSLGLIMFEMLTGKPYKSLRWNVRIKEIDPGLPQALDDLVAAMLDENPKKRPWDGSAAVMALDAAETRMQQEVKGVAPTNDLPKIQVPQQETRGIPHPEMHTRSTPAADISDGKQKAPGWAIVLIILGILILAGLCVVSGILIFKPQLPTSVQLPFLQPTQTPVIPTATAIPMPFPTNTPVVKKIIVATDANYPPFESINQYTDQLIGYDIDLMDAIADKLQFTVEYVNLPFDAMLAGVADCTYDVAISGISITEDREQYMFFSDPYINAGQVVLVLKSNVTIKNKNDLDGRVVGALAFSNGELEVQSMPNVTLNSYSALSSGLDDLDSGKIEALIIDYPTAMTMVGLYPDYLKIAGPTFTDEYYGIAVCKNTPILMNQINAALAELASEGVLTDLEQKWFLDR